MPLHDWMDRYPRVKQLLQGDEALLYGVDEDAAELCALAALEAEQRAASRTVEASRLARQVGQDALIVRARTRYENLARVLIHAYASGQGTLPELQQGLEALLVLVECDAVLEPPSASTGLSHA